MQGRGEHVLDSLHRYGPLIGAAVGCREDEPRPSQADHHAKHPASSGNEILLHGPHVDSGRLARDCGVDQRELCRFGHVPASL